MNINDLTIGQAKELASIFGQQQTKSKGINDFAIGKTCIIRTYSAGVFCGTLAQKDGDEVILTNARRMWRWWADKSISLSAVAIHGINQSKSRIAAPVPEIWLMPIEIIPIHNASAEKSIMESPHATAE